MYSEIHAYTHQYQNKNNGQEVQFAYGHRGESEGPGHGHAKADQKQDGPKPPVEDNREQKPYKNHGDNRRPGHILLSSLHLVGLEYRPSRETGFKAGKVGARGL